MGKFRSEDRFRISPVDNLGRAIDPTVLGAAEEIGQRAVEYAEKLLGDPALASNLFEDAAAAVSRVLRMKKESNQPIRNLQGYLFRAFIRRVSKIRQTELVVADRPQTRSNNSSVDIESKILVDEFLARCDPVTRDILYRRTQGFSWKEIGVVYGISAHAAESRFSQALQRVRKRLGLRE